MDQAAWRSELSDDESKLDRWMTNSGRSKQQSRTHKRMLWNAWPAVLAVAALWIAATFSFIGLAYKYALKNLDGSVRYRAEQYRLKELHDTVGHDDFAIAAG